MKKILAACKTIFLTGLLLSCFENIGLSKNSEEPGGKTNLVKPPDAPNLLKRLPAKYVAKDMKEAAEVVAETHNAIRYLLDSNYPAATKAIETAIGKAEVITTANPSLAMVPLAVTVEIHDLVADLGMVNKIGEEVKSLTDKGYLQAARHVLSELSSEITTSTSSLPLATYPAALKTAAKLTKEKKALDAALVLNAALNTIVMEVKTVPLPLIRAEKMLAEAAASINAKKVDAVNPLLDNADKQIRLAEALGYGKKDKEFAELYAAIKDLKAEVLKKEMSAKVQEMTASIRNKLKAFEERISPKTKGNEHAYAKR